MLARKVRSTHGYELSLSHRPVCNVQCASMTHCIMHSTCICQCLWMILLLCKPSPFNSAADTPVLPLTWCSKSLSSQGSSSPEECIFNRHRQQTANYYYYYYYYYNYYNLLLLLPLLPRLLLLLVLPLLSLLRRCQAARLLLLRILTQRIRIGIHITITNTNTTIINIILILTWILSIGIHMIIIIKYDYVLWLPGHILRASCGTTRRSARRESYGHV